MGRIIPFRIDRHRHVQELLPWYVANNLDAEERTAIEAHLAGCVRCKTELSVERELKSAVAAMPLDMAFGWATLRHRLEMSQRSRSRVRVAPRLNEVLRALSGRRRWALGAQLAAVSIAIVATGVVLNGRPASYHTLSSPEPVAKGNMIVMFRQQPSGPDRELLFHRIGVVAARGPTVTGAYVLAVPTTSRREALVRLRAQNNILLAEPIDADSRP